MASRKTYARSKAQHLKAPTSEQFQRACFLADLLDGTIHPTGVIEIRDGQGRLIRLEYDEP
jgi:hypothetical protein